ncbi:MAG: GNAT family N-acetyltransferase [Elusimicrobia bacterium]|nr:GNAT family N-acetyltransferase [Elusimicrobiota bacterium]
MKNVELQKQILVDSHVSIHALEERDAANLFRLTERNRARLKQWLPWLDDTRTQADTLRFIQGAEKAFESKTGLHAKILLRGQIAGTIGLHYIDWVNARTSIGYWLGAEFEGRGIMARSCRALIDYLFKELKMNRVEILIAPGNKKSQAIPRKLGFTEEGTLRQYARMYTQFADHIVYSVLAKEWDR